MPLSAPLTKGFDRLLWESRYNRHGMGHSALSVTAGKVIVWLSRHPSTFAETIAWLAWSKRHRPARREADLRLPWMERERVVRRWALSTFPSLKTGVPSA